MIANFGRQAGSIKTITDRIKEKAAAEGFDEFEIGLLAREILKERWTKDQLYKWFPTKAKGKLEESTSGNSTESKIVGEKDTDERYTDKGFISDKDKIPDDKFWKPDNETPPPIDEDHELTKKRLAKEIENSKAKDATIQDLQRKTEQLAAVATKDAFKTAADIQGEKYELVVDGINTDHFKSVELGQVISHVVSPLRNRGWKQIEIWVRNIPK